MCGGSSESGGSSLCKVGVVCGVGVVCVVGVVCGVEVVCVVPTIQKFSNRSVASKISIDYRNNLTQSTDCVKFFL